MLIRPEPLTTAAFAPFGEVIDLQGGPGERINEGRTLKFADLARLEFAGGGACLSLYRSAPVTVPFRILQVERHPLGSQAFIPLHPRPFPVIVAADVPGPGPGDLRAFLTNGRQGVNLAPGTWHHYQLSLGAESEYLVVDRAGPGENLEVQVITREVYLDLDPAQGPFGTGLD